jgi:dUTP pyrophosphatase
MSTDNITLKIKKLHEKAVMPSYAKAGDAGLDLTVTDMDIDGTEHSVVYKFGLAVEIPEGYVGLLFPRSSNAKTDLLLTNSVGVIDSGYRGELMAKFKIVKAHFQNTDQNFPIMYRRGERAVQLILMKLPSVTIEESEELSETERGAGGYGSSGV